MAPKATFVLSESPFWPKSPLSCFSIGTQRIMVSNGSLRESFEFFVFGQPVILIFFVQKSTTTYIACVQTLLAIVNESQGGTCKVCELASIIEF